MSEAGVVRAAVLTIGTELTDGQMVDQNAAWISSRLTAIGVRVVEHRSVPDERDCIRYALVDLSARVDYLFVTGGLGPTSDDLTAEVVSETFHKDMVFDEESWRRVEDIIRARGRQIREIHRHQCYFPEGAMKLLNPLGTANGFALWGEVTKDGKAEFASGDAVRRTRIIVLPGPPQEGEAIWDHSLKDELRSLEESIPPEVREQLTIFLCQGRSESEIAEIAEGVLAKSGTRVGYRASQPYVEVKVWVRMSEREKIEPVLRRLAEALGEALVERKKGS